MKKEAVERKIDREIQKMMDFKHMLKGSINKVAIKSGATGEVKRFVHQLTYKGEGNITKTIYVGKDRLAEAKEMSRNYRKAKECLERIAKLNEELFKTNSERTVSI